MIRPLIPDIGYVSYDVIPPDAPREIIQVPLGAPTVAVEVLSDDDLVPDMEDKIATYLAAGASAVLIVDPGDAAITVHDCRGRLVFRTGETLIHPALPGFALNIREFFGRVRR